MENAVKNFNAFFEEVEKNFVGRELEVKAIKLALLTKEHVFFRGLPGTAKSLLARTIFHHIVNDLGEKMNTYEIQFSKFMSEDYVVGPPDIRKLREKGIIEHVTAGTIVEAIFGYIDEFFDGSDVLIRSMLEILNERTFTRNVQKLKCPLHTCIATSNFCRDDESVQAILDRFMFKVRVRKIEKAKDRLTMYAGFLGRVQNGVIPMKNTLKYSDILKMSDALNNVSVSERVLEYYDNVIKEFHKQTAKYISDRTANKLLNVLRAKAVMELRDNVIPEDITEIQYGLCGGTDETDAGEKDEKEFKLFNAAYTKMVADHIVGERELEAIEADFGKTPIKMINALVKEKGMDVVAKAKTIRKVMSDMYDRQRKLETPFAKEKVGVWIEELLKEVEVCKKLAPVVAEVTKEKV